MRNGFTLLELLIVVIIIGILATLALPRFGNVQAKAYKATMQSDLRNFVTAQAIYSAEQDAAAGALIDAANFGNYTSAGVDFGTAYVTEGGPADYSITASHNRLDATETCTLVVSPTEANEITCTF